MEFMLGPGNPALRFFQDLPSRLEFTNGVIAVAWARRSGVGLLYSALGARLANIDVIVGMANRATTAEALSQLRILSRRLFVFHKHHLQTFHPKVYLFDDGSVPPQRAILLVGSSNLTGGGLYQNIEANLWVDLEPSDRKDDLSAYEAVMHEVNGLMCSPYCEWVTSDARIQELLDDGYISTETSWAEKRRRESKEIARRGERRQMPEAPPPPLPAFSLPDLETVFAEIRRVVVPAAPPSVDIAAPAAVDAHQQFYVRTLTENDVNKLQGRTPGTAEWDIGVTARDANPEFWGWPNSYAPSTQGLHRQEWRTSGSLRSSSTGEVGVDIEIAFWFREARPNHAAEHRIRISPRPTLLGATPSSFDSTSIVVIERLPEGRSESFAVLLLSDGDPGFQEYSQYLTERRPRHRYGYGP